MLRRTTYGRIIIAALFLTLCLNGQAMSSGTTSYGYDAMDRLATTVYEDGTHEAFLYDLMGNRHSRHIALAASAPNNAPSMPATPNPTDGDTTVNPLSPTLQWVAEDPDVGDIVSYDIFFGTSNPPPAYSRTFNSMITLDHLIPYQTYYWQVVARDSRGADTQGPVWEFAAANLPPEPPTYRLPFNNKEIVPENGLLSWEPAIDPNQGDMVVDYDIYFGTSPTPPLVASNHSGTTFSVGNLTQGTVYYWKITARDNHGTTNSDSPVWSFTTIDHSPLVLNDHAYNNDTTLTQSAGPYIIQNSLSVGSNATLTIEPGTVLKFEPGASLLIDGSLLAQGTPDSPVIFTSAADDRFLGDTNGDGNATIPTPGDWLGIQLPDGSVARTIDLTNCRLFYATIGMSIIDIGNTLDITLDGTEVAHSTDDGVRIDASTGSSVTLSVDDCIFSQNGENGFNVFTNHWNTVLEGHINVSVFSANGNHGLKVKPEGWDNSYMDLSIQGNIMEANAESGINVYTNTTEGTAETADIVIEDNTISGGTTGIYIYDEYWRGSLTIAGNDVSEAAGDGIYCHNYYRTNCMSRLLDNFVHNNGGGGIRIFRGGNSSTVTFEVRGNRVADNGGTGISSEQEGSSGRINPVITLNTVSGNGEYGMFVQASQPVKIFYNNVHDNIGDGLYIEAVDKSQIHYNNVYNNQGDHVLVNGNGSVIDARFNYWGSKFLFQLLDHEYPADLYAIVDQFDDTEKGPVFYSEWFNYEVPPPIGPISHIVTPIDGSIHGSTVMEIKGIAVSPEGIDSVELSLDDGANWQQANGSELWTMPVTFPGDGTYHLVSRATDAISVVETPGLGVSTTVDTSLYTTTGTLGADETWSGFVNVTGDLTIPAGVTLTLEPGTQVFFSDNSDDTGSGLSGSQTELIVLGTLIADGVVFTSAAASPAAGDWYGIRVPAENNDATINLTNCTISYGEVGLWVPAKNAHTVSVSLNNTNVTNNVGHGVHIDARSGVSISLVIEDCNLSDNGSRGFYAYADNSGTVISGHVSANIISGNGDHGLLVGVKGNSQSDLLIDGNTIDGNMNRGIHLYAYGYADIAIEGNTVNGGTDGIYVYDEYWQGSLTISNNEVSDASGDGIYHYNYYRTSCSPRLLDNHVHDNGGHGIRIYRGNNSSTVTAEIRGNIVVDNDGSGIYCQQQGISGRVAPVITLNTVTGNSGYGVFAQASQPAKIFYNDIHGNGGDGLYVEAVDGSAIHYNNIHDNLGSYELVNGNGSGVNVSHNYWGSVVTAQMATGDNPKDIDRIYDVNDDVGRGTVYYEPWLDSGQTLPTDPVSRFVSPMDGTTLPNTLVEVTGIAVSPSGIASVELSIDNGLTWQPATGSELWSVPVTLPGDGTYQLISRATDASSNVETTGSGINVTVDESLPTTSGALASDETWSGNLTITGDVTIPAGITLTIDPGTHIRFPANYDDTVGGLSSSVSEFIVLGTLIGDGAVFTSAATSPTAGDWYGIRVPAENNDATVHLTNCTISYGEVGLWVPTENAHTVSIGLNNTTVTNNIGHGVHIDARNGVSVALVIDNCDFSDNGGSGFYAFTENSGTQVSGNISTSTVSGNGNHGLCLSGNGSDGQLDLSVDGNIIDGNTNNGIHVAVNYNNTDIVIEGNTVIGGTAGIYINDQYWKAGSLTISDNEISEASGDGIYHYNYYQTNCAPRFLDNHVHDNGGHGIHIYRDSNSWTRTFEMRGNTVIDNDGSGIHCAQKHYYSSRVTPVITLNTVTGNGGYGVFAQATQPAEILYNDIHNNGGIGLYLRAADSSTVQFNNIHDNLGSFELSNDNASAIDTRYNYWGITLTAEMDAGGNPKNISRINDNFDNSALGLVDYADWLSGTMENEDTDSDNLTNIWEFENGLDPHSMDSDADGLNDGDEKTYWGDLWNADTDGDGLINILDPDSDNDGVLDGDE